MLYVNEIWSKDRSEYARHRIPGMTVTSRGTLLVYNEARTEGGDWARMDIFLQRSVDCGRTFGERVYLAKGTEKNPTVNNPVVMEDKNGVLHFLYCEDYAIRGARVLHRASRDDGLTWSEPEDITYATLPHYRNAFALGPGHGICTEDGTLVVPIWMVPKCYEVEETSHVPSCISTLYSRDYGASWQLGEILIQGEETPSPSETEITPTGDGRIYLNARVNARYRAVAYSRNGYAGWTPLTPDRALVDPICFGSTVTYDHGGTRAILFANCDCTDARRNVTVRMSRDGGVTFPVSRVIDAERGGYVESAVDNVRGLVYVLYETDWGKTDRLAVFDLDYVENGTV